MAAPMPHVGKLLCRYVFHFSRSEITRNPFTKTLNVYNVSNASKFSSKSNKKANDFYGIAEETSVNGVKSLPKHELHEKYAFKDVNERDTVMAFGSVRVEDTIKRRQNRRTSLKRSNLKYSSDQTVDIDNQMTHAHKTQGVGGRRESISPVNFYDEQYFGSDLESKYEHARSIDDKRLNQDNNINESTPVRRRASSDSMNYVDSQYFYTINEAEVSTTINQTNSNETKEKQVYHNNQAIEKFSQTKNSSFDTKYEDLNFVDKQYFDAEVHNNQEPIEYFRQQISQKKGFNSDTAVKDIHRNSQRKKVMHKDEKSDNAKKEKSAFDVAMEMRKNLKSPHSEETRSKPKLQHFPGPVDSKGFRILRNQVPDIMNTPSGMVVKLLRDNIIYNKGDVLAIEKPYGLPSHGGPGVHMSVAQLLPDLARLIDPSGHLDTLHMVHRLDRQTTGVMLLAKTSEAAWRLHRAFRKREVVKKYWVLTKGVPTPEEGVIDIPMAEGTVDRYHIMVLKPEITDETRGIIQKSSVETSKAVTQYRVLTSHGPAALVECTPTTGVKHQIRVHLAFGLNTPVLGDHKYSHITKVAPQRLHPHLLERLGIRQSKVRHLPMMLHAKSLLLPEFQDGRNIFISCRLPLHFRINMSRLKIKPPKTD